MLCFFQKLCLGVIMHLHFEQSSDSGEIVTLAIDTFDRVYKYSFTFFKSIVEMA